MDENKTSNELSHGYTIQVPYELEKQAFRRVDKSTQKFQWASTITFHESLLYKFPGVDISIEEIGQVCEELVKWGALHREYYDGKPKYVYNRQNLRLPPYYTWPCSPEEFEFNYWICQLRLENREELDQIMLKCGFAEPIQRRPKLLKEIVVKPYVW